MTEEEALEMVKAQLAKIPPSFNIAKLPEAERDAARILNGCLAALDSYVRDFEGALELFNFAECAHHGAQGSLPPGSDRWMMIAARDGAMTIFHFSVALQSIQPGLGKCASIRSLIAAEPLRTARKLFESQFPTFEAVRNAVAHRSELVSTPEKFEQHSFTGTVRTPGVILEDVTNAMISDTIINGVFTSTINGRIVSYGVSKATLDRLIAIKNAVYAEFRPRLPSVNSEP